MESSLNFQQTCDQSDIKSIDETENLASAPTTTYEHEDTDACETELQVYDQEAIEETKSASQMSEIGEENLSSPVVSVSEKLKIRSIVDAVGFLIFPSAGFINKAFKDLLIENGLFELFK